MSENYLLIWKRHLVVYLKFGSMDLLATHEFMSIYFPGNLSMVRVIYHFLYYHFE